jgi:PIN domain nuclease of toxin-antitoxin system
MRRVLDASALLAYLHDERGADRVADAIADGATMSAINLAEVLSSVAAHGIDPVGLVDDLSARGVLGVAVIVQRFDELDAIEVARLRPLTRHLGLSLGDRACLALAGRLRVPALTADAAWAEAGLANIEVRLIR